MASALEFDELNEEIATFGFATAPGELATFGDIDSLFDGLEDYESEWTYESDDETDDDWDDEYYLDDDTRAQLYD